MATKTIDVTLVSIRNAGPRRVSPRGGIWAPVTRAVSDEQVFQSEPLYLRREGQSIRAERPIPFPARA